MSILDTLEADSQQLNNKWLTTDFKEYFNLFPSPDKYKQAWLLKRVIELEGTATGKTITEKEAEIIVLKQTISNLQSRVFNLENDKISRDNKIVALEKVASAERQFLVKRTAEQLQATRTFYLNAIHAIPDNENKITSENIDLKIENNKLLVNLSKSNWKFRKELVETLADVDHLRNDLTNTILDKLHVSKELDKVKKELDDILNKPTSEMGTQTEITGEEMKNFANDTLKGLEAIWDQIDLIAHYPGINVPSIEKAKKVSKNFSLWLNGYKNEWGDVIDAIGGYKLGERERERSPSEEVKEWYKGWLKIAMEKQAGTRPYEFWETKEGNDRWINYLNRMLKS